ncbi:MAG: 3-hydroxyacyl-ACP dehydratase FabZ [Atopobiaceae bacterium]
MNKEQIKQLLPHREPMLLLDDVTMEGEEAIGHLTITGKEFFVQGHFPGNPVVPGVILCEMLAQNCCVLLAKDGGTEGKTPFYTSLDKVRFRHPVRPGDTVELRCHITRSHGPFHFAHGEAYVGQTLCCQADMSFALVDSQRAGGE